MSYVAAGTALSRGYCDPLCGTLLQKYLGRSKILVGKYGRAKYILKCSNLPFDLFLYESCILMTAVKTQTYEPGLRQIGKMHIFRQSLSQPAIFIARPLSV